MEPEPFAPATGRDRQLALDAQTAAAACGTPAYVYDLDGLDRNLARIEDALEGVDFSLRYFEFANRNPAILEHLQHRGYGVSTARPPGIARALHAGFDVSRIELSGFGLTAGELCAAAELGVSINLASVSELADAARSIPGVPVGIRVDFGGPMVDKRGIPADEVVEALGRTPVPLAGIHTYIGTNIASTGVHLETVRRLLDLIDALPRSLTHSLRYVNTGGGFGYDYDLRRHFGWAAYGGAVGGLLGEAADRLGRRLELKIEVGRSLVVDCGFLVTRVNHAFVKEGRPFVVVDSNLSHCGRPSRYGFDQGRPPYSTDGRQRLVHVGSDDSGGRAVAAAVVGNSHYSRDWFGYAAVPAGDPDALVGDGLVVLDAGAYCEAMSDRWADEPRPPVVAVSGGEARLVTERESAEDLIGHPRRVPA